MLPYILLVCIDSMFGMWLAWLLYGGVLINKVADKQVFADSVNIFNLLWR